MAVGKDKSAASAGSTGAGAAGGRTGRLEHRRVRPPTSHPAHTEVQPGGGAGADGPEADGLADEALRPAQDRFISAWGQMGATWGISRTMAEAHALLYITGRPLCTDEVMERLAISRGNASMSLRALLDWGIVSRVHKRGDRKEYFQAEPDAWLILQSVVRERMKREVHPVLAALAEIRDLTGQVEGEGAAAAQPGSAGEHNQRLDGMIQLLQTFADLGQRFVEASPEHLRQTAQALTASAGEAP